MGQRIRLFDIAANLSDSTYFGLYHKKQQHPPDIEQVIQRANQYGVDKFLLGGLNLEESQKALDISKQYQNLYCTIGVHPCYANTVNSENYFEQLFELIQNNKDKCIAVGECGLDYDRFKFSSREQQLAAFPPHFELAERTGLPLYLHSRNTQGDFEQLIRDNRDRFSSGVVHSFTGTQEELELLLSLDLYIGVNGCSLKTQENIQVVQQIPLEKIMLETDCPYCEIRKSSPAFQHIETHFNKKRKDRYDPQCMVRDRNEPCTTMQLLLRQVLEAVSQIKGVSKEELAETAYINSCSMFGLDY